MHRLRLLATLTFIASVACSSAESPGRWSDAEKEKILRLELRDTLQVPADSTNAVADNAEAALLGQRIFFDPAFSSTGQTACATCHKPDKDFTDGRAVAAGLLDGRRNTPSVRGRAFSTWLFWDGRKDSLWAQALGPFENPIEQNVTRIEVVRRVAQSYRADYERIFGALTIDMSDPSLPQRAKPDPEGVETETGKAWAMLPEATQVQLDRAFSNVGKAIAAYERRLLFRPAPFDRYAASLRDGHEDAALVSAAALDGLRLFVGKANCIACHDSPLLTDNGFHNLGVPPRADETSPDDGRRDGARTVLKDEFNCAGAFSDDRTGCRELHYLDPTFPDFDGAFRTPSLRDVALTAPYMHAGQFASLSDVLHFYNRLDGTPQLGHRELTLTPLALTDAELDALVAFLESLSGDALPPELLKAP